MRKDCTNKLDETDVGFDSQDIDVYDALKLVMCFCSEPPTAADIPRELDV
jgi:hypothetical protein